MCHVVNSSESHRVRDSHILYGVRGNSLNDIQGISKEISCCSVFQGVSVCAYSLLQTGWHRILRLILKTFNLVPGVPGFSWDLSLLPRY